MKKSRHSEKEIVKAIKLIVVYLLILSVVNIAYLVQLFIIGYPSIAVWIQAIKRIKGLEEENRRLNKGS